MIELTSEQNAWLRKGLLQQVGDLYDANIERAVDLLSDSDEKKLKLPFTARIDFSGTTPKLTTKVRCSKSWPDERVEEMDDLNQPALPLGLSEGEEEKPHIAIEPGADGGAAVVKKKKSKKTKKSK